MRLYTVDKSELSQYFGAMPSFIDKDSLLLKVHINLDQISEIIQSADGAFVGMSSGHHFGIRIGGLSRLMKAISK